MATSTVPLDIELLVEVILELGHQMRAFRAAPEGSPAHRLAVQVPKGHRPRAWCGRQAICAAWWRRRSGQEGPLFTSEEREQIVQAMERGIEWPSADHAFSRVGRAVAASDDEAAVAALAWFDVHRDDLHWSLSLSVAVSDAQARDLRAEPHRRRRRKP